MKKKNRKTELIIASVKKSISIEIRKHTIAIELEKFNVDNQTFVDRNSHKTFLLC